MKALLLSFSLLTCGDSVTTHTALSMGAQEQNPIQSALVLDAAHALETAALWQVAPKSADSHPKLTKGVLWTLVAWESYALIHNLHEIRQQQGFNQGRARLR